MTISKLIQPYIDRKFAFQIATPTHDLSTPQDIVKFINTEASYSLIPGVENSSLLDPEKVLLQILPLTINCIVDIVMPFIEINKKKAVFKHHARYIISNQQLLAIRVKPSDNWPKSKSILHQISTPLQNFYKENGIVNYPKEIFVGQFLVTTKHFKIAPLFASQLSSIFDNTTINLLNDYYSLGCEVFSVVNDLSEEKKKLVKDPFEILKNYRRQNTVLLYSGVHLALDQNEVYKTKSCALQNAEIIKKIHISNLDKTYTDVFIGDFNRTKKIRIRDAFCEAKIINSDIQILDFSHLRTNYCNKSLSLNEINNFDEPMDVEEDHPQNQDKLESLMLYLWHLYVNVNKRKPFILPCPLNDKDESLMKIILLLAEKSDLHQNELVQFLKLDSKVKIPKKYEQQNFKSIFLERIPARQIQMLYVYFPLRERIAINNIEKEETFLSEVQKRIVNCSGCISEDFLKTVENKFSIEKSLVTDEEEKFVQKIFKRKSGITLETFYIQVAKYFPRSKINIEFMQNMFDCLKNKAKKQFTGTAFQNFILQSNFDDVRHIFAESEQKFFSTGTLKAQEEQNQTEENEPQQTNFRGHIKKVRSHCNSQKKNYYFCHICNCLFGRKDKASYGRFCIACNNFVCHSCFDLKTGQNAQSEEVFQQCLVCQHKCDCQKCTKKKIRFEPTLTQKNSNARQGTQIFDSFKDLGGNDLSFNNETKQFKGFFIKSEMVIEKETKTNLFEKSQPERSLEPIPSIKACWTCELSDRVDRIIRFQCSSCKGINCLSCEKFERPNRNWVLRGSVVCNKCYDNELQNNALKIEIKNLKGKNMALQHENTILQRQKMSSILLQNNSSRMAETYDSNNQYFQPNESEPKNDKGGVTPLFERSGMFGNQGKTSPTSFHGKKNPSENGSIASFGGQKIQKNNSFNRRNDENSSVSDSIASKKSEPQGKSEKKRKNSSCSVESAKNSSVSFQNKPNKPLSNSSHESIESGQCQDSSSERNFKPEPKKEWKKNYHQDNNGQEKTYDTSRGGFRGRGRGRERGGYQNQSFDQRDKKWNSNRRFQNRDQNRNQFQNKRKQGFQNNRWQKDDDFERKKFNDSNDSNKKWNSSKNYNNSSQRYESTDNNRRQQESKPKDDEERNYYLGKIGSKVTNNDEDFDY